MRFNILYVAFVVTVATLLGSGCGDDAQEANEKGSSYHEQKKYAEAEPLLREAADNGYVSAQWKLGVMYGEGLGVEQDETIAAKWYLKAANENHTSAQTKIGHMYEEGRGVNQDYTSAAMWYRRAAKQGDVDAQMRIAYMCDNGLGVAQSEGEAMRWYRMAAGQGNVIAQSRLGEKYETLGNYTEAENQYRRAAEQGDAGAKKKLDNLSLNQQRKPTNRTLSGVVGDCKVKNASESIVIYHDTIIPESVSMSQNMICQMAREMVDVAFQEGELAVKQFCAIADQLADRLGNGSYSRAITKMSSWEQDNETEAALGLLNNCKSNESRLKLAKESIPNKNIFSVGTFENNGKTCLGYLVELMPQASSGPYVGSKAYELRGFEECKEFAINEQDREGIFHPEQRPNGKLYGDYILQSLKYDGEIPDNYNYKGKQFAFYSE